MFVQGEYLWLLRACVSKRVCLLKYMRLCVKKYTSSSIPEMNVTFCHAPAKPDAKTKSYQAEQNNDLLQPVHIKRTPCFFCLSPMVCVLYAPVLHNELMQRDPKFEADMLYVPVQHFPNKTHTKQNKPMMCCNLCTLNNTLYFRSR